MESKHEKPSSVQVSLLHETREDLRELLLLTAEYFNAIEKEKEEALVNELLEGQKEKDLHEVIDSDDETLQVLRGIVTLSPA